MSPAPTMTLEKPGIPLNVTPKLAQGKRLTLCEMDYLSPGKKARMYRLLYQHGPGNGTMMFLPIDQGLEHGPVDFFVNPPCGNPQYQFELAKHGHYSAIALHVGLADKYLKNYAGEVPLVLKLNGKTCVPSDKHAFSSLTSSVEDAVRLGADAVGYTLFVGSPSQAEDILQFNEVRRECEHLGMPIIVWAYPRGEDIDKKGGKNSFYAIHYAARVAAELGADVVKVNIPSAVEKDQSIQPDDYATLQYSQEEKVKAIIGAAGKTMVVFSGGSKIGEDELTQQVKMVMEAGAHGLIFGRNMWQRPMDEALSISHKFAEILRLS